MLENTEPGHPEWQLSRRTNGTGCKGEASRKSIEGYASQTSYDLGETLRLFVSSKTDYTVGIYRVGWYDGIGGRETMAPVHRPAHWQAMPPFDPVTGLVECQWTDPFEYEIPSTWVSGVYVAKLTSVETNRQNYVMFVVRDDARASDFLVQLPSATAQAYNCWGGKSLYGFNSIDEIAADYVSFDRPDSRPSGAGELLFYVIHTVRWLEREGFDVTYCTNVDTHARPELLANHQGFLSIGHDEYWSREMRDHVQNLPENVSVGFLGSNAMYWQIRLAPNALGEPDRTIIGYKHDALTKDPFALDLDPTNDRLVTTRWRDAPVSEPEASLIGVQLDVRMADKPPSLQDMIVTGSPQWAFEGTGLQPGDRLPGLLGHEVDRRYEGSPAHTSTLALSPFYFYGLLRGTSEMTLYGKGTGIVFASGSLQWAWGLDDYEGAFGNPALGHTGAQKLMRNILERMRTPPPVLDVPALPPTSNRLQVWPLPFRGDVLHLALEADRADRWDLAIYDLQGRRVRTLPVEGHAASVRATWDGRDATGQPLAPGVWLVRARGSSSIHTAKILVVR